MIVVALEQAASLSIMPTTQHSVSDVLLSPPAPTAYPLGRLTQQPWHEFTKQNGYHRLASRMQLKGESDISTIESLWNDFSPHESVFDLWEVRKAFLDGYEYTPLAVTLFEQRRGNSKIMGVLPLSRDEKQPKHEYRWLGTNWPEDNTFFVRDPEIIPLLLCVAPDPLTIDCIKPHADLEFLTTLSGFSQDADKKYFLDLSRYRTADDFVATLKKKRRYNIRRDRAHIEALHPTQRMNDPDALDTLFTLNIARFREKFPDQPNEYSTFENVRQQKAFRSLINHAGRYQVRLLSTIINDTVVAVEMGLVYKKTYYALTAGAAISRYSGLGVYSNLMVMEDALRLGCTKIDFLEMDLHWKEHWHLDSYYQYQFTK